jgi:hypothetical protein
LDLVASIETKTSPRSTIFMISSKPSLIAGLADRILVGDR